MGRRRVELCGLIIAWACIVVVRVVNGSRSGVAPRLIWLDALEVVSLLCLLGVMIAFSQRGSGGLVDPKLLPVRVLALALVALVVAGVLGLFDAGEGANIGLGLVYLIGLLALALGSVMVAGAGRHRPQDSRR